MAVQTLDQVARKNCETRRLVRKPAALRRPVLLTLEKARRQATATIDAPVKVSKLEEVEERLLADALERYGSADDAALDTVLDDMSTLSDELDRTRRRPLLLRSTTSLNRMEDLLLEAVLRNHPNAERAFDRLLDDVTGDDDETAARAEFDMTVDNDFDGLA